MTRHYVIMMLCSVCLAGCATDRKEHMYVVVPSVTGPQQSISIWKSAHHSPTEAGLVRDNPRENRFAMETIWAHFRKHAQLALELAPELRDIGEHNRRFVEKMRKERGRTYSPPVSLDDDPFGIWRTGLKADVSGVPSNQDFDSWLLAQYLSVLSGYYGNNICVESPVPPRSRPDVVRRETTCVLLVRRLDKKTIEDAQMSFLRDFLMKVEGLQEADPLNTVGPESFTESVTDAFVVVGPSLPSDLPGLWQHFFAFIRSLGIDLELVKIAPEQNFILVSGRERDMQLLEKVLRDFDDPALQTEAGKAELLERLKTLGRTVRPIFTSAEY